jgi:hypothetical protein
MDGVVGDCLSPHIVRRGTSDFTSVGEEEYTGFANVVVMNWQVLFECDIQHHEQEALQLLSVSLFCFCHTLGCWCCLLLHFLAPWDAKASGMCSFSFLHLLPQHFDVYAEDPSSAPSSTCHPGQVKLN